MSKRKKDHDYDYFKKKIKRLEKKLMKTANSNESRKSRSPSPLPVDSNPPDATLLDSPTRSPSEGYFPPNDTTDTDMQPPESEPTVAETQDQLAELPTETNTETEATVLNIEPELLDILGADPTISTTTGKDIHTGLASRLEHIATLGLSKETRKELNERFLVPGNCLKITAPEMNAEIKAAVTETVTKRDKGIEIRQKQLAAAISGLASLISNELESSKEKDTDRLKKMMDVSRILCDIQHAESVTRRNFAIYAIKKDLKDHLINSKIDKYLFGENLAETLKAAKAVNKSGTDMKQKPPPLAKPRQNSLNWRSQDPARRPPGPPRGREPVTAKTTAAMTTTARFPSRKPPPAAASKSLQHQPRQPYRR